MQQPIIEKIQNKIYTIRKQKVMLDKDLAELFCVETKRLKEQVKRNIGKFPGIITIHLSGLFLGNALLYEILNIKNKRNHKNEKVRIPL